MNIKNKKWSLFDGLLITLRYSPIYGSLIIIYKIFSGFIPAITIGINANFINAAIAIVNDSEPIKTIYYPLFFMLLLTAFNIVSDKIINFAEVLITLQLRKHLREIFVAKRAMLSYSHIEDQESWDLITRTANEPEVKINSFFNYIFDLIKFIISVAGVLWILMVQVWWAGALIITISVPLIIISYKSGKKQYKTGKEVTKIERKYKYLSEVLNHRDNTLERTLFNYSEKINEKFVSAFNEARIIKYNVRKKSYIRMKTGSIITSTISMIVLIILIPSVYNSMLTIGMFISLVNALFRIIQSMSWELPDKMEGLATNREIVKDLNAFSALSEEPGGEGLPSKGIDVFESLEFKDVYFKYPKSEKYILKGLSFKIEKGKHYSFVGKNGAGKTTITKIITGLFRDYNGTILLNGRDLKEYGICELKAMFCGVFQDFAKYSISIKNNIAIGNAYGAGDGEINAAVTFVGLDEAVAKYETGLETFLGKINKNGVDFSGGEWQRLAMARAIVNPAPVKILDEPTATLDPIGESLMYQRFEQISLNKTTIFISHRLGSTKLADIIFVLDDGKLAQSGSHEELMALGGVYSEMFESQRSWYL